MKLNLHILFDELHGYAPLIRCSDSTVLDIEDVCLLGTSDTDRSIVYVVTASSHAAAIAATASAAPSHAVAAFPTTSTGSPAFSTAADSPAAPSALRALLQRDRPTPPLVLIGDPTPLDEALPDWRGIVLPEGTDALQAFSFLQDVFRRNDEWERQMLFRIARRDGLQSVLDLGIRYLNNPVALFDTATALVMKAGEVPETAQNTIWNEVLADGFAHFEKLAPADQRRINQLMSEHDDEPYFIEVTPHPGETELVALLHHHGNVVGTLGCVDICKPFTAGQASVLRALRDLLELALQTGPDLFKVLGDMTPLIDRLLDGDDVDRKAVESQLARRRWTSDDCFLVMYLARCNHDPFSDNSWRNIAKSVMNNLEPVYAEPRGGGLALLFRGTRPIDTDELERKATPLLRSLGLAGGLSMEFHDLMNVRRGLDQAMLVAETFTEDDSGTAYSLDERFKASIVKSLDAAHPLESYCHPGIVAEYRSGEKGRELVRTLRVYLLCGNNVSEAARRLNLHRNTMVYRLEQLRRICAMDFDQATEDQLLLVLVTCLVLEEAGNSEG